MTTQIAHQRPPSPFQRLAAALKESLQGCASPHLGQQQKNCEEVVKATKSSAAVQTPIFELAVVAGPAPQQEALDAQQAVKELLEPEQGPQQASAAQDAVEEDAVTVAPRVFSEVGQCAPVPSPRQQSSEWLFSNHRAGDRTPSRSERLPPIDDPADKLQAALALLASPNTSEPQMALTTLRQLVLHHRAIVRPRLNDVVPVVLHQMCSQLPGLSHLAIVLLTELLETFGDSLAPYCQGGEEPEKSVVLQLLLKAQAGSEVKRFVVQGACLALRTMVARLSAEPAVELLQPYTLHKQPRIRALAADLLKAVEEKKGALQDSSEAAQQEGTATVSSPARGFREVASKGESFSLS